MLKRLLPLMGILLFSACAPKQKPMVILPPEQVETKIAEARAEYKKASLLALKKAFEIFESLYIHPSLRKKVGPEYVKTGILIDVREKELGILDNIYMARVLAALKNDPLLAGFTQYVDIAQSLWIKQKGQMGDINMRFDWRENEAMLDRNFDVLKSRATKDEFDAYIFVTATGYYDYYFSAKNVHLDLAQYSALFPDSPLIMYRAATYPEEKKDLLVRLIERDAGFFEAFYHLGNIALKERKLLEAERNFLRSGEGIPESPQITIALASIYFATEEIEKSLDFYEKTLAINQDYREALLGKAICLSYLGKNAEAITTLEILIARGKWLIGESYYWLAWNQHKQGRNEEAAINVDEAKSRLPTDSDVFSLSGLIAAERGELERAEKDFKESLSYSPYNSDALLGLGKIYDQRGLFLESGTSYESAAKSIGLRENFVHERIREIQESSIADERKARFITRKEIQLRAIELSKATAFYNAAAGYLNAGDKEKAMALARQAATHPALKEKAEEFISRIKIQSFD